MNEKKKGFNLFPEYVWMIFVGMLLAIIILTNVIPGHADEVSPTPTVTPVPTSALDPTDACVTVYVVGRYYLMFSEPSSEVTPLLDSFHNGDISIDEVLDRAYFSRYVYDGDNSAFYRDVQIALTQLSHMYPGLFFNIIDWYTSYNVYYDLYNCVAELGIDITESYLGYANNRVLEYANAVFTDVPIWVWNTALPTPSPTPTPDPSVTSSFGFIGYFSYSGIYYYVEVSGSNIFKSITLDISNSDVAAAMTSVGTTDPNTTPGKSAYLINTYSSGSSITWAGPYSYLYFTGDNITVNVWRMSSSLISQDVDYIKANYSYVTLSPDTLNTSGSPYFTISRVGELNCLIFNYDVYRNTGTCNLINDYGYNIDVLESYSSNYKYFNNSVQLQKAYAALLTRSEEPAPTQDPVASPTPEPLPTSSESIHVIMPTGTPTPTPPFTVPGGSDGTSGSDSPGSIGSGLSSGQTSGVLQAWNMYVSDNPAMLFLTSTFQALPPELLYPLYILLFILLLLAVIRLFVHFSGG